MGIRKPSFLRSLALLSILAAASCTDGEDPNETARETPGGDDTGPTDPDSSLPEGAPGIVVTPTSGLKTTEAGGTAAFTVALASKPTANVTIVLTSSNPKEGTVDKGTIAFTPDNWDAPQTVTVTGVDDTATDGPQEYKIALDPAVSGDARYNGLDGDDVTVTNADDDSPGVTVTPVSGLKTTEAGGEATFTVRLNTKPTADVTIGLSSNNDKEGTVSPAALVFTALNWSAPQTVTVKGVDDGVKDGNQTYKIVTAAATSADKAYEGVNGDDVDVVNVDDESAGITVTPTSGLTTSESGGTATFTVRLNSKPSGDVTIPLSSSKTTEGTVSPASLTFTSDNWNAPQTVTVTGVDDSTADGNQTYNIVTGAATSTDTDYNGANADDVSVTNVDDESAGFTVTPTTGLRTSESGGTATFTIRLNSKPNGSVAVGLTSNNVKEGTVAPATVSFTTDNWNAPQTVTVTGVDDSAADGDQTFKILGGAATGTDTSGYVGLKPAEVSVINTDNDTPGFTISAPSGNTTESGGTASFTVRLNTAPTGTVQIPVATTNAGEGTVSTAMLMFDATSWSTPQAVTITGVDDAIADGAQPYTIALGTVTGTDTTGYVGKDPTDVSMINVDNDSAGITVNFTKGMTTTEKGGTATFTVVLNSQPKADVTIPLGTSNKAEGTVSPTSLTFTSLNWKTAQTVTITGVNDDVADGNQAYSIITGASTSTDSAYNGINPVDVPVTNNDDDVPGVIVTPTTGLVTSEKGGTASFTIVLSSSPTAPVTVGVSTSDSTEGTLSIKAVTFDSTNWSKAQTVTVTGADDSVRDGDVAYTIVTTVASSTDPKYSGLAVDDVAVVNQDNEPDCSTTVCGGSCDEIYKKYPSYTDGNYLILPTGVKSAFTVYCHNMASGRPLEYLNISPKANYSQFSASGTCATCGGYTTTYSKVRLNLGTIFSINTWDRTFTSGSGGSAACYTKYGCTGYELFYGSAGGCAATNGVGVVDLSGNPFVFGSDVTVGGTGYKPTGKVTFSTDRRSATFTGGGGLCGAYGFWDLTSTYPGYDTTVPLTYAP